jgi:hypothetical protein
MDHAARTRQRVLALFLPAAALLYISAEGLNPKGTDTVIVTMADALKVLPIAAMHSAQLYVSGSLSLLALGALAVSYAAIATLVRGRGSAVATVAALLGGLGAFCGAMVNVLVGVNLAAAATAHMAQDAAARFLVTSFNSGFEHVFSGLYFIGIFAAPVLMGFALWRSRSVPRWLTVLFTVGIELAQQVSSAGPVLVVLFMLPFAAAMVLLAARIWQAAARPASHHVVLSGGPAEVLSASQQETDEIREVPSRDSGQPANESGYTATAAEHPRQETAPNGR